MIQITIKDRNGIEQVETIYNINDFPYNKILVHSMNYGTIKKRKKAEYYKIFGTFDIETTSIPTEEKRSFGFMYVWQICLHGYVVCGRTWEEWVFFIEKIKKLLSLNKNRRLVFYVHFLPFEFQFIRNFVVVSECFARAKREVLRFFDTNSCIEFRCSHALTNMSLLKFTQNSRKSKYIKMSGEDFDYSIRRLPITPLTNDEWGYCFTDVYALWESINELLEEDSLISIPMTSTGYVRRIYRNAVRANEKNVELLKNIALSPTQYMYIKSMSRGGNCHANPLYADNVLEDMDSWDITSSYPFVMMTQKFPMSKFREVKGDMKYISKYACIIDVSFFDFECKNINSILYVSKAKCGKLVGGKFDNGRVISADMVRMVITDVDYNIIVSNYNFDEKKVIFNHMEISDYDYLPLEFREVLIDLFYQKTSLKGKDDYLYMKSKNKINSSFGMMLTDILNDNILYVGGVDVFKEEKVDIIETLNKHYQSTNLFLAYQWGVWVTAWARFFLQKGIDITSSNNGSDCAYVDTDSVKHLGEYDGQFCSLNEQIKDICESVTPKAYVDYNGNREYLGVWEKETAKGKWKFFKTLGAKKYLFIDKDGTYHLTLSGVNKQKGSTFFQKVGIDKFTKDTIVPEQYSGRSQHTYNDTDTPYKLTIDGCTFTTGANIGIVDNVYTIGLTEEYEELLKTLQNLT